MFIREQMISSIYDLREEYHSDPEMLDVYIWSPVSCRWTSWTFEPKQWLSDIKPKRNGVKLK
jgi:hypothetical protein